MTCLSILPKRLCKVVPFLMVLLCLGSVQTVGAAAPRQSTPPADSAVTPTPPITPDPPNSGSTTGGVSSSSSGGGNFFTYLYETVVKFANDTVASGIMFGLDSLLRGIADQIKGFIDQGITLSVSRLSGNDVCATSSTGDVCYLWDSRYQAWQAMLIVSSLLLPVTLLATVVFAMRGGMSSFTSRSDAKDALSQWFVSVGLAGASYFILYQGFRFADALTGYINNHLMTNPINAAGAVNLFTTASIVSGIVSVLTALVGPVGAAVSIFCFFFVIIGAIFIWLSLSLAALAMDVILFIVVAIAPLVCILSPIQPFRWIFSAWLKVAAASLLLIPGNAFLWRLGSFLVINTFNAATPIDPGKCLYAILLWIGIASIIVGLNYSIGRLVYSAAIEVAQKAGKATMDTVGLALNAAGLAAGSGLASAAGASSASGSLSAGIGGGPAAPSSNNLGASSMLRYSQSGSGLTSNPSMLASFMKSSGLPLVSNFGAGMENGLRRGPTAGLAPFQPHPDGPFPGHQEAVDKLKSQGISDSEAESRIGQYEAGLHTAEKQLGVSSDDVVRAYGYNSHEEYLASGANKTNGLVTSTPQPKAEAPIFNSRSSETHDVYYANQVMAKYNQPLDSPQYASVLKTVHNDRTRGGDSHPNIMSRMNTPRDNTSGEKQEYARDLNQWLANEKDRLRRRGAG
jgi:hypothetical protein